MSYFIDTHAHPLPATTPCKLIEYLRQHSRVGKHLSLPAYMFYLAHIFEDFSGGMLLRTDTPDELIHDLIAYGWLYTI